MLLWFRDLLHLLRRISLHWIAFLGTTAIGIGAQMLILVLTGAKRGWFRWSMWKRENRKRALPKELRRAVLATAVVWLVVLLISVVATLRDDHYSLEAKCERLKSENRMLSASLDTLEKQHRRAAHTPRALHKPADSETAKAQTIQQARELSADILSYASNIERNRPPVILSVSSSATTERTMLAADQFERNTLLDFLRRFSGRLYEIQQRFRDQGINTSRLEAHLAQLMNTQMLQLVAVDVEGMATQLEKRGQHP